MRIKWRNSGNTSSATVDGIEIIIRGTDLKATYDVKVLHDGYHVDARLTFEILAVDRDDDAKTAVELLKGVATKLGVKHGT